MTLTGPVLQVLEGGPLPSPSTQRVGNEPTKRPVEDSLLKRRTLPDTRKYQRAYSFSLWHTPSPRVIILLSLLLPSRTGNQHRLAKHENLSLQPFGHRPGSYCCISSPVPRCHLLLVVRCLQSTLQRAIRRRIPLCRGLVWSGSGAVLSACCRVYQLPVTPPNEKGAGTLQGEQGLGGSFCCSEEFAALCSTPIFLSPCGPLISDGGICEKDKRSPIGRGQTQSCACFVGHRVRPS